MKKALLLALTLVLSGFFTQPVYTAGAGEKHTVDKQPADPGRGSAKIRAYLQETVFLPRGKGNIAADYHAFGQDAKDQYVWAYIAQFSRKNDTFKLKKARSGPLVLMISKDGAILGHWEPEPGENYTKSIQDRFPPEYHDDVLHFQSEHEDILRKLKKSVRIRAAKDELVKHTFDLVLAIGEIETITFDANRTTGYTWQYRMANPEVADIIFDAYLQSEPEKNVLGAGGIRAFGIKGKHKGITTIELRYARDWNPQDPDKKRKIRVKVEKAEEADLHQPNIFLTEYIGEHNWEVHSYSAKKDSPPEFSLTDDTVSCRKMVDHPNRELMEKTIDGRQYCLRISSEGTAGSTYKTYTYATARKTTLLTV